MDTYNENLQVTVAKTMDEIEKERLKIASSLNAAGFTLYHAEGARITAENKLVAITEDYNKAEKISQQGVENENIAVNLLASAKDAESELAQTVTNIATAAANVERAADAVALVSADVGAVFNLVSAEDYGTDIFKWSRYANALINATSYQAEQISQFAMEASYQTAEVTSTTVAAKAEATKAAVEALNAATTAEFTAIAAKRTTANDNVAATSKSEKVAEGSMLDNCADDLAIKETYTEANTNLNFNLRTSDHEQDSFKVSFSSVEQPFDEVDFEPNANDLDVLCKDKVKSYYVIIVKEDKRKLFQLAQAESLLEKLDDPNNPIQAIEVTGEGTGFDYSKVIEFGKKSSPSDLHPNPLDSDGDNIKLGDRKSVV